MHTAASPICEGECSKAISMIRHERQGFPRLLAAFLLLLSGWDCTDGSSHWTLNQATGAIELALAAKRSHEVPPPNGSTFLDLTWALDG